MTIETRYNIGDRVWFMHDNKVKNEIIIKIDAVILKDMNCNDVGKTILYGLFNYSRCYAEHKLFPTKEELLKSL